MYCLNIQQFNNNSAKFIISTQNKHQMDKKINLNLLETSI